MNGSPFKLNPQKLVYGGSALGHYDGRTVLVRGALPGEQVEVEAIHLAKGVLHARTLRVITPSPDRVAPPCPYFGTCGGCHYQHLDPARQSEIKREILRETLRRVGGIDWQGDIVVHRADPWRYRNHAQLKIGRDAGGGIALGFFEADSHRLVPIAECPILSPRLNLILEELTNPAWRERLAGFQEIDLFVDDRDGEVMLTLRGECEQDERLAQEFLKLSGVSTVAFEAAESRPLPPKNVRHGKNSQRPGRTRQSVFGKPRMTYHVGNHNYEVSPGSFFQASRFLLPQLASTVTNGTSGDLALDLYAGVGLFTLPLARSFRHVIAVEAYPAAAADLGYNVQAAGLTNVRAVKSKTSEFLRRYAQGRPDWVVLDPPRAGAQGETLRHLSALAPLQICYVSCQPPTLARDLAYLLRHGYRVSSIEMFDLFPQTFHIESVVKLTRS